VTIIKIDIEIANTSKKKETGGGEEEESNINMCNFSANASTYNQ